MLQKINILAIIINYKNIIPLNIDFTCCRGRSLASGVAAAASYIVSFVATKTCLSLKTTLSLSGMFFVYGSISVIGFVVLYLYMPETEGRSLEEIEESYKSKKSKLHN